MNSEFFSTDREVQSIEIHYVNGPSRLFTKGIATVWENETHEKVELRLEPCNVCDYEILKVARAFNNACEDAERKAFLSGLIDRIVKDGGSFYGKL